jgi:hypothetical protein
LQLPANPLPTRLANFIPAAVIFALVAGDVFRQRVQREMRRGKGDVRKERLPAVLLGMFLQKIDRVVGNGNGRIVATFRRDRRQRLVIQRVILGREVPIVVEDRIRAIESAREGECVDVPLARVIGTITESPQVLGQQSGPCWPAGSGTGATREIVAAHLLSIITGQERRPRGPTSGRIVKLRVTQSTGGERIQVGCRNLAAITAQIGEAQVVRQNHDEVRFRTTRSRDDARM